MNPERASCVVSGSFTKFKPQIDEAITLFQDYGITVLSPAKGELDSARNNLWLPGMRPLPNERYMSSRQAVSNHLQAIERADFLYIVNPGGYIGRSALMEWGWALGQGVPIYAQEPLNAALEPVDELLISELVTVKPAAEVALLYQNPGPRENMTL